MQRLTFVGCVVLLMLPVSLMADHITLDTNTSGSITVTRTATGATITFNGTVSGPYTPPGLPATYSFAGVGPLMFSGCTAANGCPTVTGTGGNFVLTAPETDGTRALTWTLFDGDSTGYTFNFTTPTRTGDLTLIAPSSPPTFDAFLLSAVGTTFTANISSGQADSVASPVADGGTTVMLLGGALVGVATLRRRFRA